MNNNELIEYDKRTIINDFRNILHDGQNTLYNQGFHTRLIYNVITLKCYRST